ncbi:AraC family transcriptional regulator [Flavobacterium sp. DG2-3]|uniref:helix-turn-helix domain-containing protein n=1 Tax=Flavobacterium sp. DG2-3 TaxID=3068317 RepID=UPI00273EDE64|nr:AraC family transcriptional regulator [Flavobacterium sp. DG2-3]MDP5199125.1 AraC family transcriptional regulator [Flavobacterium sp. DG2-3]
MKEFEHYYTLSPEWHNELAKNIGATIKDGKLMHMPESVGKGYSLFLEVIPGMSVLLLDFVASAPIKLKRLRNDNNLRIIHFDFSDDVNSIQIQNSIYKIGYKANLGFAFTSNNIENTYQPVIGKRVFTVRLIIDEKLLMPLINNLQDNSIQDNKFDDKELFFYDYIDSNSKILMYSIKNKSIQEESFDLYLRGITLRLLANFGNRYSSNAETAIRRGVKKKDLEAFNVSKKYMLANLKGRFPGVDFLANKAEMSVSKYKLLSQKIEGTSPSVYFGRQKMNLAKKLLAGGCYLTVNDVVQELNFKRRDCFTRKYFSNFGRKPAEDFIVKKK